MKGKPETGDWEFCSVSETGNVREENEDCCGILEASWGKAFIVADGMGGHNAGAEAARLTVRMLRRELRRLLPDTPVERAIQHAFAGANRAVYLAGHSERSELRNMGSTAVLLLIRGATAHVAHVGDSRAYLYRRRRLRRLTKDHSLVQRMVDSGLLLEHEARTHPDAGVIYRAMGDRPEVDVDVGSPLQLARGDGLLLCSDGLCGYVDDKDIERVLRSNSGVAEATECLINLALDAGGEDNVTVQYLRYGGGAESWPLFSRLIHWLGVY